MFKSLTKLNRTRQLLISILLVILVAGVCYVFSDWIDYKVVAFVLLLTVSLVAIVFDIVSVLLAATLSALAWNFFFIEPRFTFHIHTAEDGVLFLTYFLIVLVNAVLTNRIRRFEKLEREKLEREKTVALYNTLLNSLSHELKTPIAAIIGATDNLLDHGSQLSEQNRLELTENISLASLRLNQQVGNLLSMSRLESGFIQPRKDWTDINELVYEVIHRLEQPLKDHRLHIQMEDNLPLYRLDYGLLEQVLYNLLYNAAIYTPEFGDIYIRAKNISGKVYELNTDSDQHSILKNDESSLQLEVEDRGPGFPPEEIGKVFDKFYRLSNSKTGGTGLGLSIVKGFVEAENGIVTLENVPHGALFTIRIPAETSYINQLKNE